MTVKELLALDKGVKIADIVGVFSRIGAPKTTATGKKRQPAVLEDNTGEIQVTIWGGALDKFLYGSTFKIKEGYIDEYDGAKRITVNKNADIELVAKKGNSAPKETPAKKEPAPAQPAEQATTGAVAPQHVPVANTDRTEEKTIMAECIEDAFALVSGKGFTEENVVAIINTLFIERNKRIRKERF